MDVSLVREQLRIEEGLEDNLLQQYIDAAKTHVEMHCDRKIVASDPQGPDEMLMTKDVEQAILLLVGHWYAHREAVAVGATSAQVELGLERLLWYRKRF